MAAQVNHLADYKRELLARSNYYRQSMAAEVQNIRGAVLWIPRTLQVFRWASPVLTVAAPLLGILIGKKIMAKPDAVPQQQRRKSLFAKILAGIAMYRRVRGIVETVRPFLAARAQAAPQEVSRTN